MGKQRQRLAELGSQWWCPFSFGDSECLGQVSSRGHGPTPLPLASLWNSSCPSAHFQSFGDSDPVQIATHLRLWLPVLLVLYLPCDLGQVVPPLWSLGFLICKMGMPLLTDLTGKPENVSKIFEKCLV